MVYKQKYSWAIDKFPVSAQVAGETIEKISADLKKENIAPADLLEASRDANAPLHDCFEWDNSIAAEKYRLNQAGDIIRNIRVTVTPIKSNSSETATVRAYVNVSNINDKGIFIPIKAALEKDEYRVAILKNAAIELKRFNDKYSIYSELAEVCATNDAFIRQIFK